VASFSDQDLYYMNHALAIARQGEGKTSPNPMVGAVLVRDGEVIGEGAHVRYGAPHAEVAAMVAARNDCKGATLYVNLEPCSHYGRTPPCADALIRNGIRRVVAAVKDPNPLVSGQGFEALKKAGIQVDVGAMEEESRQLNEVFFTFHEKKRPFITAKWAMTLDGRTSVDPGASYWISNELSREYVHSLRAGHDAVLVGIGTVIQDNPRLTVRLRGYRGRQPSRIIVDAALRSPLGARCLSRRAGGPTIFAASSSVSHERVTRMENAGHKVILTDSSLRMVNLEDLFSKLHYEGITSVLVEGGRQIHTSLFKLGLVDRVVVFIAPKIFGGKRPTGPLEDLGINLVSGGFSLERVEIRQFATDVCIEGHVVKRNGK